MNTTNNWTIKRFEELTTYELYDILALRTDIFVVEQTCPYPEVDYKDIGSLHMFIRECDLKDAEPFSCESADTCTSKNCNKIVAYLRILPRGFSYPEVSIGRVSVREEFRGNGIAREMLEHAIAYIAETLGENEIQIGAQEYLLAFYKSLGFEPMSEVYLEDGLPHLDMLRRG
ncbi:MAG: GNAT family N-acetyltransferase [Clostridiales bacterium]|nr:GNAT family N-acetyltransferase [Clostridiales bacterium]